jgi:hypothetical protein
MTRMLTIVGLGGQLGGLALLALVVLYGEVWEARMLAGGLAAYYIGEWAWYERD